MDSTTFDGLSRNLGSRLTRRSALRGLFAGAAALVAGGAVLQETEAKRRKKGKGKNKKQNQTGQSGQGNQTPLLQPGSPCEFTSQCTPGYICEVPVNGSNSDKYCSGGPGAICGLPNEDGDDTYPFCAVDHKCVNGHCQFVPDEI